MDVMIQIIFFVIAALIVGAATMVVTVRNVIHSALWLISSFFGVGMLYLLLEAEFLAIAQVLIYVGAVSVLVLFAIMLTRQITNPGGSILAHNWWIWLVVSLGLFGAALVPTIATHQWTTIPPTEAGQVLNIAGTEALGRGFMQEYLLPFQAAAVLLLVALVGAIIIALEERGRRQVLTLAERAALMRQQTSNGDEQPAEETAPETTGDTRDDEDATITNIKP